MAEVYKQLPGEVESFDDMFAKGMFYGRLRMNSFKYDFKDEEKAGGTNHTALGLGGSLIYKTAVLNGFSFTTGMYTSQNPFDGMNMEKEDVGSVKAGKGTFDRNKIKNSGGYDGEWGMTSLAQNYIQYHFAKSDIKAGRQIFESFITKSNDTKMIPNTFNGYTLCSKDIPGTTLKVAYLSEQKLRDHTDFHDVIAYDSWNENDDSAVHKGLTKASLEAKDIDTRLIILDISNKSVENLKLDLGYAAVPDLFATTVAELNYKIGSAGGLSVTPGVRYYLQQDDGAGKIGGAALSGSLAGQTGEVSGYKKAESVDGSLVGARIVVAKDAASVMLGHTAVSDDADLIAPWRGFPTGGYSRSMAQYNWIANTKTSMVKVKYDFGKAGLVKGFTVLADYAAMDFDEKKGKRDRSIVHADLIQKFASVSGLEAKVRMASVSEEEDNNKDTSYNEYRFELNYLF